MLVAVYKLFREKTSQNLFFKGTGCNLYFIKTGYGLYLFLARGCDLSLHEFACLRAPEQIFDNGPCGCHVKTLPRQRPRAATVGRPLLGRIPRRRASARYATRDLAR